MASGYTAGAVLVLAADTPEPPTTLWESAESAPAVDKLSDSIAEDSPGTDTPMAWDDWQVRIGALFLDRSNPPARTVTTYLDMSGSAINAAEANFPIAASPDVSLRHHGTRADIDFRYFGVSQTSVDIARTSPLVSSPFPLVHPTIVYNTVPDPGSELLPFAPLVVLSNTSARATSWLQSAELNLRRDATPNIALLTGFRYLQFREEWQLRRSIDEIVLGTDMIGRNELFGFQIGSEAFLLGFGRLRLEGAAKAGVFGNAASSDGAMFMQVGPSAVSIGADARRGSMAFVGDLNTRLTMQLTSHIAIQGGYQLLWLAGVATATDQLPQFNDDVAAFATNTDGSVFFHGAMVGLECGW